MKKPAFKNLVRLSLYQSVHDPQHLLNDEFVNRGIFLTEMLLFGVFVDRGFRKLRYMVTEVFN
jgi:hypothetical protein